MCAPGVWLVVAALMLLPCAAARAVQSEGKSVTGTGTGADANGTLNYKSLFAQIVEMVKHEEEDGDLAQSTGKRERARPQLRTKNGEQILEVFPRDVQKKEKFLKHLTGPLYFSPKCRKHVYRLYHNTRDCTIPAYYKRCARLLTRLAGSPRCLQS